MKKLIELYIMELTREGATMTIGDVPAGLRSQVETAIKPKKAAKKTDTTESEGA